jgi:hypothetical protein
MDHAFDQAASKSCDGGENDSIYDQRQDTAIVLPAVTFLWLHVQVNPLHILPWQEMNTNCRLQLKLDCNSRPKNVAIVFLPQGVKISLSSYIGLDCKARTVATLDQQQYHRIV